MHGYISNKAFKYAETPGGDQISKATLKYAPKYYLGTCMYF